MDAPELGPVCFYSIATHLGGSERSLLELVRGLHADSAAGFRPWVLLPRPQGPLVERLKSEGVRHSALEMPGGFFAMSRGAPLEALLKGARSAPAMAWYLARLTRLLGRERPAILHTNGLKCQVLSAAVGPVLGVPVVWHLRDIVSEGPTLTLLRGLFRATGAYAIANSAATARSFIDESWDDPARVRVVHNGLDPAAYPRRPHRRWHERFGIDRTKPLVGIVGVLARWKGQSEFLKMAAELVRSGSDARFVIIGGEIYDTGSDQGYGLELREEARRLGLAERVFFTGFVDDPAEAINGLDVVVHASIKPEPFGRVILEAMACGVPALATRAGGVPEFVDDGRTGLLVEPGNVAEMTAAVSRLLNDASLRQRLGEAGHEAFLRNYTYRHHVERTVAFYREIRSRYTSR